MPWTERVQSWMNPPGDIPLQVRLLRAVCLAIGFTSFAVILPTNRIQGASLWVDLAVAGFGGLCLLLFRRSLEGRHHPWVLLVAFTLSLDVAWFGDGGSEGSVSYFFFMCFMLPMGLLEGLGRWITLALMLANGWGLLLLEDRFPHWVTPFHSPFQRFLDFFVGFPVALVSGGFLLWVILDTYRRNHQRQLEINAELARSLQEIQTLQNLLPVCAWCRKIRDDEGLWTGLERYFEDRIHVQFTHGACPDCEEKLRQGFEEAERQAAGNPAPDA